MSIIKKERVYCTSSQHGIRKKSKIKWIVELTLKMWMLNVGYRFWNQFMQLGWWKFKYSFFTSAQGRVHVLKGWEKAGIKGVVTGREVLPAVDPYQDIYTDASRRLLCIYVSKLHYVTERHHFLFGVCRKEFSMQTDIVANWLKTNNSRTSMNCLWTLWDWTDFSPFCFC